MLHYVTQKFYHIFQNSTFAVVYLFMLFKSIENVGNEKKLIRGHTPYILEVAHDTNKVYTSMKQKFVKRLPKNAKFIGKDFMNREHWVKNNYKYVVIEKGFIQRFDLI